MTQKFSEGPKGGVPPWKEGETVDLRVAHWCLFGPRLSGMYETVRELVMAENKIEGVLAGMCEVPAPNASKQVIKAAAEGGKVDALHTTFRTQDWGWAMKYCDIHVIHTSQLKQVGELKPKAFFLHGTPEACLENDLQPKVDLKSYESAIGYVGKCEATIVTSERAKFLWQPYDYSGTRIHKVNKGVDLEWWQRTSTKQDLDGAPSVLYGEIWRGIKHPMHTLFAVNLIYEENPEVRLNAWGCNIKKGFWEKMVEEGQFNKFFGRGIRGIVDWPEHYYTRGDVLVSPGLYGDVSRVQQEAMACGCPVVGWDTDPWKETHPYKYARAYDCRDLADKILEAWNDVQDDPEGVQKRCREMAERYFDVNVEAKQVVGILRKTVASL